MSHVLKTLHKNIFVRAMLLLPVKLLLHYYRETEKAKSCGARKMVFASFLSVAGRENIFNAVRHKYDYTRRIGSCSRHRSAAAAMFRACRISGMCRDNGIREAREPR